MQQSSRIRLANAFTHLICVLGLLYLPTTVAAQPAQMSTESADRLEESTAETTAATADTDSPTEAPDSNATKAVQAENRYDDLLSSDKNVSERAFRGLHNQVFAYGEAEFDFLDDPESLISALSKTMLSDDEDIAAWSTSVIAHIALVGGNIKYAKENGIEPNDYGLSEHYQQFEKFGINDALATLATEAEGITQQFAIEAIILQDIMSEKNDDLTINTFRSPETDDDLLNKILLGLAVSVYDGPGGTNRKRPISSELASALYGLLSYESRRSIRSLAAKVLAYSGSNNARDVVFSGLIAGSSDEVFQRSLWILKQHNYPGLKEDPRHSDVMNSLVGESKKQAYSEFVQSLD